MRRIIVVDDLKENRYLLQKLLEGHNYTVETASNGIEALEIVRKKPPDMIITDTLMPKMDGFQLCRELKSDEGLKDIPVLFYSATYTDEKSRKLALDIGAVEYVIKPQEPDVFVKIVNKIWDKYSKGEIKSTEKPLKEKVYMKMYNERLIQKLEKKMLDLEKSEKRIKYLYSVLGAVRGVNQLIVKEKNRGILLQKACDILIKARGYNAAWLGILKDEKTFTIVVGSPFKEAVSHFCEQVLRGDYPPCIERAFIQKAPFMVMERPQDCGGCLLKNTYRGRESVIMRITHNGKLFGLLVLSLAPGISVKDEEEYLLREVANDIAFGLHNIELEEKDKLAEQKLQQSYKKLRKTMEDTIYTIGKIAETRDPYTSGHQKNVSQIATFIAQEMKLPQDRIEGIRITSLVHDIGKISLPAEILNKPTKLSEIEYSLIKDHSQVGYDVLKSIEFPWPVAQIVLQHHERLNGSGYPQGLEGEDILLEAKIIGVVDVVEAMSSHRPYRPALGIDKALEEISKNKGILYDPEVVDACLKLFKKKEFKF
jgi:response regulator RpfG family c-di-GMP phosphodiesterase